MKASIIIAVLMILFLVFWMVLKIRRANKNIYCDFCNNSGIVGGCPCPKCLDPRGPFFD